MKVFVIDVTHCNGCYCCQIACKDEHVGNDWAPYAKTQPETGQFWLRMQEHVRGSVPKVKMAYVPVLCQHCDNAPCIEACPSGAMYKREDGLVHVHTDKCTGCQNCVDVCPYDCIFYNNDLRQAQKCTGCAHLLDTKGWTETRCVDNCPTEAITFGEEADLQDLIAQAEVLHPEYGTKPRVYYIGLPKRFIAGTVYDPAIKDVIEDAVCTLTAIASGEQTTVNTDDFGDFWFEGLEVGDYSLVVAADGRSKTWHRISTDKDVNLGDIPLAAEDVVPGEARAERTAPV